MKNLLKSYSKDSYHCECLVVGSGAGGAIAAAKLAASGKDVILLEEGGYYETKDFKSPPSEMIPKLYRNNGVIPFLGNPIVGFSEARCVGGGTVVNGGIFSYLPDDIQMEWANKLKLDFFKKENLHSAYRDIEKRIGINKESILPGNRDSEILIDVAKKLKLPFETSKRTTNNCSNSNRCPVGCPTGAKQSVLFNYLVDATESGGRILSKLRCTKILKKNNTPYAIQAFDESGRIIHIYFKTLFLAAGVTQTPFLIRKSGLSSRAGSKICYHTPLKMLTVFNEKINAQNGTSSKSLIDCGAYKIASSNFRPEYAALSLFPHGEETLNQAMNQLDYMAIFMSLVRTHSTGKLCTTILGQPLIVNKFDNRDEEILKDAITGTASILFEAGAARIFLPLRGSKAIHNMAQCHQELANFNKKNLEIITVHGMSSCNMGFNKKDSIINQDGKVWDYSNTYVIDASALPGPTGIGPQATIMAMSSQIVDRYLNVST